MEKQFAYGKTIRLWKNNSILGKQFDFWKTIRLLKKKNSIIEKKFDYKDKIDFEKKSILKSIFSTLNFFFLFCFYFYKGPTRKQWMSSLLKWMKKKFAF